MTDFDLANGDELFLVIAEYVDLEWHKYRNRMVEVVMKNGKVLREDHSTLPPFTTVRFRLEDAAIVSRLRAAVESYRGLVLWHMFEHQRIALPGKNWVIRPMFVDELKVEAEANGARDVAHYIGEKYPDLSRKAYVDLRGLSEQVRSVLRRQA